MQPRLNQAHSSALLDLKGKIGPSTALIDKIGPIAPYIIHIGPIYRQVIW